MTYLLQRMFQLSMKTSRWKNPFRTLTTSRQLDSKNYEGDGKTVVSMLNRENQQIIMVDTVSSHGFRLNIGIFVCGPIAVFPRTVLQWNAGEVDDITPESLSLFALLEPKLDLFIIGTGEHSLPLKKETLKFLREKKINVEILRTENACATFNFLNVEGRCVAGAFLPPATIKLYNDEFKLISQTGYGGEGGYIM